MFKYKMAKETISPRIDTEVLAEMTRIRNNKLLPYETQEKYIELAILERNQRIMINEQ